MSAATSSNSKQPPPPFWTDGATLVAASKKHSLPQLSSAALPPHLKRRFMRYAQGARRIAASQRQAQARENRIKFLQARQRAARRRLQQIQTKKRQLAAARSKKQAQLRLNIERKLRAAAERAKQRAAAETPTSRRLLNHAQNLMQRLDICMKRRLEHHKKHVLADWKRKPNGCRVSLHNTEEAENVLCTHASSVQVAWRSKRIAAAYRNLLRELGVGFLRGELSLAAMHEKLQSSTLIDAAEAFLGLFAIETSNRSTKVFLGSFVMHWTLDFNTDDATEETEDEDASRLSEAARHLVDCVKHFDVSCRWQNAFSAALATFCRQFEAWRVRDRRSLKQSLGAFLGELRALRRTVRHQHDYSADWRPRLDQQQSAIEQRLHDLFGAEAAEIIQQVKDSASDDESLTEQAEVSSATTSFHVTNTQSTHENSDKNGTLTKQTQSSETPQETTNPKDKPVDHVTPPQHNDWFVFGRLSKQQLIHEIHMQDHFRLEDFLTSMLDRSSIQDFDTFLRENKQALFDALAEADIEHADPEAIVSIVVYVKQRLFELAPRRGSHRAEIEVGIDVAHVRLQLTHSAFDVRRLLKFCVQSMKQFCAPARDAEIRAIEINLEDASTSQDLLIVLVEVVQTLDRMTFDMINFLANALKHHVAFAAAEYEKSARESEEILLPQISACLAPYNSEETLSDTFTVDATASREISVRRRVCLLYVDVLRGTSPVPPFLAFDRSRLASLQFELRRFAVIAAVATFFHSQLGIARETFSLLVHSNTRKIVSDFDDIHVECLRILKQQESASEQPIDERFANVMRKVLTSIVAQKETLFDLFVRRLVEICRTQFLYGHFTLQNSGFEWMEATNRGVIAERILNPFQKIFNLNFEVYKDLFEKALTE